MDVSKSCLKRFVEHVCEMVLKLLCALNSEEMVAAGGEAAKFISLVAVITVA